jgi:hypothetical protein
VIDFALRPPSTEWEAANLTDGASTPIWLWVKPAHAPLGIVARVPFATLQTLPEAVSVRSLIAAAGLDIRQVASWIVHGVPYLCAAGTNPYLDLPLRPAVPGGDVEVLLHMLPQWHLPQPSIPPIVAPQPIASAVAPSIPRRPGGERAEALFAAIDADWQSILQIERLSQALRKQVGALHVRLQSLNRDLNTDEHRAADNQDRKDWQDARRFLRESAANLSRFMREHDIGITSNAGSRSRFETFYEQHVVPKKPFEGLSVIQQEFESYRKTVQSLMLAMQSALGNAGKDGEQRAMRILNRIAAKARNDRSSKAKRPAE